MTVKEIMERAGTTSTGRALAYIKDALDEMAISSETHVKTVSMNIAQDIVFKQNKKVGFFSLEMSARQ